MEVASPSGRTDPHSSRRAAIEAAVLGGTEDLLAEGSSFSELRIEQIARRAGISRTAFYFYFRDKRELLTRLTNGISDVLYVEGERWWNGVGDGPTELRSALEGVVARYGEHAALLRAVVELAAYDASVAGFWREVVDRFVAATARRIEAEQAGGRVGDLLAAETAFALCWMTERTCHEQFARPEMHPDRNVVRALTEIWVRTLYGAPE